MIGYIITVMIMVLMVAWVVHDNSVRVQGGLPRLHTSTKILLITLVSKIDVFIIILASLGLLVLIEAIK